MKEDKRLIEIDFPIEYMNLLAEKESNVASRKPIYKMHKWWARRVGGTFRAIVILSFLRHMEEGNQKRLGEGEYTILSDWFWGVIGENGKLIKRGVFYSPIDLGKMLGRRPIVLDPFMGGGTTIVESLRLGCKVVGIDLNPIAWFTTKMEVDYIHPSELDEEFERIKESIGERIKAYYKTICPKCLEEGIDSFVDSMYVLWVKKVKCANCNKEVKLHRNFVLARPKKKQPTVFCPNCYEVFTVHSIDLEARCPACAKTFTPNRGHVSRGIYTCPHCGQKYGILDTVRRQSAHKPRREGEIWYPEDSEMFAVEYFCTRHGRNYKRIDDHDQKQYEKACQDFENRINRLKAKGIDIFGAYIPSQKMPKGFNTKQTMNYGYVYFWQMFNIRQLHCLSMLLEEIMTTKKNNVRDLLLMVFSSILEYNNTFCDYNFSKQMIFNMFSHHVFWPRNTPVENNAWGAEGRKGKPIGTGSFEVFFNKAKVGIEFMANPFERLVVGRKTTKVRVIDSLIGKLASNFDDLINSDSNVLFYAKDAQDLSFITGKVDAVITDPPYYANVMYSELAAFFYVWLRLGLKDQYNEFKPLYPPREQEIVVFKKIGKTEEAYINALTNVFRESRRVLTDDGLLVFTYHHTSPETWATILKAVLDSGFYIVATYPIYSEMSVSTHIRGKEAREFDTVIVARKRLTPLEPITWEKLKDEIYVNARDSIERVLKTHPTLTNGDKSTVILGKYLEAYSKHYPNVLDAYGRKIEVKQAIKGVRDIIQDLYSKTLIPRSDIITDFYLEHLVKEGSIDYNEILKLTQTREMGVTIGELKDIGMLSPKGNYLIVVDPLSRGRSLAERMHSTGFALPHYVDVIHYYYHCFVDGRKMPRLSDLGPFDLSTLTSILKFMAKTLKDETYKKILDMLEAIEKEPKGLEKYMP